MERWTIRVYGDARAEVLRNGAEASAACGATGNQKVSPKQFRRPHSIFELSFRVQPGGFGMQVPRF